MKKEIVFCNTGTEFDIVKSISKNTPICWGTDYIIEATSNRELATVGFHKFVEQYVDDSDTVGLYTEKEPIKPARENV